MEIISNVREEMSGLYSFLHSIYNSTPHIGFKIARQPLQLEYMKWFQSSVSKNINLSHTHSPLVVSMSPLPSGNTNHSQQENIGDTQDTVKRLSSPIETAGDPADTHSPSQPFFLTLGVAGMDTASIPYLIRPQHQLLI